MSIWLACQFVTRGFRQALMASIAAMGLVLATPNIAPAIVGGTETRINEFPWMLRLVDVKKPQVYCGAALIADQYALTAAHCLHERDTRTMGVVASEHDIRTDLTTSVAKMHRISNVVIHPQYRFTANDIAVVKIDGRFGIDQRYCALSNPQEHFPANGVRVGAICLPRQETSPFATVMLAGWGLTEFGGAKAPTLQKADVRAISRDQCKETYGNRVTEHTLCTYAPGRDSCHMDSGGPVTEALLPDTSRRYQLAGIITAGIGCDSGMPSLNMRVSSFVDWIRSITPGVRYPTQFPPRSLGR
ncbi:serine protease [Streptomyces spectabilis]|uniref:Secreted trypsin-like serine protease n=1 Tax=Streptomyces spectabilis TaxID=68270 RepID=A0A7W8B5J2_STRST|nr:serine protease [Streptomyces spectabilis]MBB5110121.1 secreted trypsin-like serine protease [Streptomyces spectabilis]GGV58387.1 hypothetical protein GCM10010245_91530 [Streptomyces spectabilis]